MSDPSISHAGAILTIDLDAIVANYRLLRERAAGAACAAVVKADAYGVGMEHVAPALAAAGCASFFVAHVAEGIALRRLLGDVEVHVLHGLGAADPAAFAQHRLVPVLNSLAEVEAWSAFCRGQGRALAADLHVDTGMARLGLAAAEVATLAAQPERAEGVTVALVVSHLACAEEPSNPLNARQRDAFRAAFGRLAPALARPGSPPPKASLANSSGIFLGPDYRFDVVRPGAALFGVAPVAGAPNPMAQVITLQGKILQVRDIDTPRTVGYGATHRAARGDRIATVAVGYADGYPRTLGNKGCAYVDGARAPVVGRVSMDLITLDVSAVPWDDARPGSLVELIGPHYTLDAIAQDAGTIAYEVLTRLGRRYHRVYVGGGGA